MTYVYWAKPKHLVFLLNSLGGLNVVNVIETDVMVHCEFYFGVL
jgi:hypothetical protein